MSEPYRAQHYNAVAGLVGQTEELMGIMNGVMATLEEMQGQVFDACSDMTDSAQAAIGAARLADDSAKTCLSALHTMSSELDRYGRGF